MGEMSENFKYLWLDFNSKHTNNKAVQRTGPGAHRTPARLAFADHMNRFIAGDRTPGSPKRAKMLTRVDPPLDGPVILFQDVIEILHRSMLAVLLQNTLVFELHNRRRVSGMLVGVDDSRRRMVCSAEREIARNP